MKGHGFGTDGFKAVGLSWVLGLALIQQASAGEVLRLRAGEFRIEDRSESVLSAAIEKSAFGEQKAYFVVQFDGVIHASDHEDLFARGVEPVRYLPEDALLVRGAAEAVGLLVAALSRVRAVVPYESSWKISESLRSTQDPLLITLARPDERGRVETALRRIPGTQILARDSDHLVVVTEGARVGRVASIEGIEWIDEMPLISPLDFRVTDADREVGTQEVPAYTGFESGTRIMNFAAAWERGLDGRGQVAAIADTGLDTGNLTSLHQDLSPTQGGFAIGLGARSWEDPQGHGTHVAGSVVGTGALSDGRIRGGARAADFYIVSLWSPIMNNLFFSPNFQQIAGGAYGRGARIHSNSWGSMRDLGAYDSFARSADEYLWNHPEMLMLFAAGNSGEDKNRDGRIDPGSVCSPGTAKNVLTVGASENYLMEGGIQRPLKELPDGNTKWGAEPLASDRLSDNPNGLAAFSSRGPTRDGRLKPEVVAPGTNIVSTRSRHASAGELWGAYGEHYVYAGGTSMATPLTAGAATVVRQYLVRDHGFAQPSGALVKAMLIHTSIDLFPGQFSDRGFLEYETPRPNVHEGYGRVDVAAATSLPEGSLVIDDVVGLTTGQSREFPVQIRSGASLRATLVYADAPGAVSSAKALVNNLDLRLVDGDQVLAESADAVNNVEMIEARELRQGRYRLVVQGTAVPMGRNGKQPFSLVVSTY